MVTGLWGGQSRPLCGSIHRRSETPRLKSYVRKRSDFGLEPELVDSYVDGTWPRPCGLGLGSGMGLSQGQHGVLLESQKAWGGWHRSGSEVFLWGEVGWDLSTSTPPSYRRGLLPSGSLRLVQTQAGDSGHYECTASNLAGSASRRYILGVQGRVAGRLGLPWDPVFFFPHSYSLPSLCPISLGSPSLFHPVYSPTSPSPH